MVRMPDDLATRTTFIRHLSKAITLASLAHQDQIYRGYNGRPDQPYILHPLRVMNSCTVRRDMIVAVLHDTLEDNPEQFYASRGFDLLTVDEQYALILLTRDKRQMSYDEYINRIVSQDSTGIARRVKILDLRDNLSNNPPDRLASRYRKALDILIDLDSSLMIDGLHKIR